MNRKRALGIFAFVAAAAATAAACAGNNGGSGTSPVDSGAPGSTIEAGATTDSSVGVGDSSTQPVGDGGTPTDSALPPGDAQPAGDASTITAFDQTLICFGNGGTGPCSRTVDNQVTFPTTGTYSRIILNVTLNCPTNGCDPWDRVGSIDLVTPPAQDGGAEVLTELGRFITPYGITSGVNSPPSWNIDVTELRPLLSGTVTLRAFIDTWVPQGNAAAYGGGWVLGATFNFTAGTPEGGVPVAVVPIWVWTTTGKEPTQIVYGDPAQPISTSLPPQTVQLPAGATSFGVRSTITGHGQANLDNCSEFCSEDHTWQVGSTPNQAAMWRTDCANFPSSGTYQYSRAGWCPGANVIPWDFDVTSQVGSGPTTTVTYSVSPYLNTCNGTSDGGGLCTGCQAGESCTYDGSDHTQPFYYVQSLLIGFK